jgi:RNA polymerase sigma factor (sigma-70 family)
MNYSTTLDSIIPLTEAEEAELILRLPDEEAATELVLRTLPSAVKYLNRVCRGDSSTEELISMCYAALRKSVKNVKPGKGRFMIYSKIYLRSAMFSLWKRSSIIRGVSYREMTDFETFQKEKKTQKNIPHLHRDHDDRSESESETYGHPSQDFEFEQINISELWSIAKPILDRVLTDHEKLVIQLRFEQDYSFEEIAEFLAVSRSAAQGSCERALRKVRVELNKKKGLKR